MNAVPVQQNGEVMTLGHSVFMLMTQRGHAFFVGRLGIGVLPRSHQRPVQFVGLTGKAWRVNDAIVRSRDGWGT